MPEATRERLAKLESRDIMDIIPDNHLSALNEKILAAHAANDVGQLGHLYAEAARAFETRNDIDHAAFFHVQAFVFSLDTGDLETAEQSRQFLVRHGREPEGAG